MECLIPFNNTTDLLADAKQIIDAAKEYAYRSVNVAMHTQTDMHTLSLHQ